MKVTKSQSVFLVLLRLVCGSHFFYQGMIKLADRSWSSYSYLMNSEWIFSGVFRWMAETKAVLAVVDAVNMWGLILIGMALILGVFVRFASVCGFLLLGLYYAANPPFDIMGSGAGGEYSFIVNKQLVEMAAFAIIFLFPTGSVFGLGRMQELFGRRGAGEEGYSRKKLSRREMLRSFGTLPVLGVFAYPFLKGGLRKKLDAISGATAIAVPDSYKTEYARLKTLKLDSAEVIAKQKKMPVGRIGNLNMGRVISGSNLISLNMHARDLDYVNSLAAGYNTEERIFMTLKKCEEYGINTIVLKDHNFEQFKLSKYWDEWGGKMQWIADVITEDIDKYEELLVKHLELGASAAYLWGGASDIWYNDVKRRGNIVKAFEIMRKYKIPAGIGAHRLEPIVFCEKEGLVPDFYFKTFHHYRYWSAHPKANRKYMEMWEANSEKHEEFHDNLWCENHEETAAFMREVKVPWIAFKVLAAGAIGVEEGLKYAFESGADFVCLGMFDFQVKEDAELASKAIGASKNRERPWRG